MARLRQLCAAFATSLAACAGAQNAGPPRTAATVSVAPEPKEAPPAAEAKGLEPTPGTRELVAELTAAERIENRDRRWHECRRLLDAIRLLADPRGADTLASYVADSSGWPNDPERVFRRTIAAFALAELADLRALPVLAARLLLDPLDLYRDDDPNEAPLRRTDQERVVAARLIAELATLNPTEYEQVRKLSQEAVHHWLESGPSPHANGLRALASMRVQDGSLKKQLRAWADPPGDLPKARAQPPFDEKWVVAQSALRYVGALRDDKDWPILEKQLARRPKALDATMDGLMGGGNAMAGMTIRALAMGAANGFAEWGDARAVPLLLKHVEDDKQNEQSRQEAGRALGFVLDAASEPEITSRLRKWKSGVDKRSLFRVACLFEALRIHPVIAATPLLLELTRTAKDPSHRLLAARALGHAGLDSVSEGALIVLLDAAETRHAAALTLLLGGSVDAALRAAAAFPGAAEGPELSSLRELYVQSLDSFGDADLASGKLFRFVRNARALAGTLRGQKPLDFAVQLLGQQLSQAEYDSGPRSLTRVVLRKRLLDMAKSGSVEQRSAAVDTLELGRERGALLALGTGSDPVAKRAANAAALLRPAPAP